MHIEEGFRRNRRIAWGLVLIAVGGAFLLDQAGIVELPALGQLWPAILIVLGGIRVLDGRPGSGAMLGLMGLAFFAAEFRWMGLRYHNFWPLLLIAVGAGMVIRVLSGEDARDARTEVSHE